MSENITLPMLDSVNPVSKTVDLTALATNHDDENTPKVWPKETMMPGNTEGMVSNPDAPQNFVGK